MCIGVPMVVLARVSEAEVDAQDAAGAVQRIDTRLVGAADEGEWLLVFQGAARERLTAARAAEIAAALDLLARAMGGDAAAGAADPGFMLPSAMSAAELAALTGRG